MERVAKVGASLCGCPFVAYLNTPSNSDKSELHFVSTPALNPYSSRFSGQAETCFASGESFRVQDFKLCSFFIEPRPITKKVFINSPHF